MEILQILSDPILPVFAIAVIGYISGKLGKTTIDEARQINKFAMNVLLPIFIFGLIAKAPISTFSFKPVLAFLISQSLIFTLGFLIASKLFGRGNGESILLGFMCIFANNALYVLPISVLLYGADGVLPISTIVTLDAVIWMALAMIALQMIRVGKFSAQNIAVTILKTPTLLGVLLGVIFSLGEWPLPGPLDTFVGFAGAGAAPIALYSLGVVMSEAKLNPDKLIATFSTIKIIVFPVTVWLALELIAPNSPQKDLFLLGSAGPAGITALNLALYYNVRTEAIAQVIIYTSVLTLISLAILA
ncbi:MAG: AEC family transporter [Rhizobiaceae bacterium]|nr:AEC family transporter [Rhizobiaceae bacterium]